MNADKLKVMAAQVRIGGKGSVRRKKKVVQKELVTDDKKLQSTLKRLGLSQIAGIEEVCMFKYTGDVIHFNNPKLLASLPCNTFAISGNAKLRPFAEMLPTLLHSLGIERFHAGGTGGSGGFGGGREMPCMPIIGPVVGLVFGVSGSHKRMLEGAQEDGSDGGDELPILVGTFDEPSKNETAETYKL